MSSAAPEKHGFFQSPRNQRYALIGGAAVLAVAVATLIVVLVGNTGDPTETFSNTPAQTFQPQKEAKVDPEARRVAGRFILTAVAREKLGESYDLTHPDLRQGYTRAEWMKGTIPVVYYPSTKLDFASFKVDQSYENEIVLEVVLVPAESAKVKPASFYIGLKRLNGKTGPWKVYYWAPNQRPAVPDNAG